jgi:hypothetical protein
MCYGVFTIAPTIKVGGPIVATSSSTQNCGIGSAQESCHPVTLGIKKHKDCRFKFQNMCKRCNHL